MTDLEGIIKEMNEREALAETLQAALMEAEMETDLALHDERVCKAANAIYDNKVEMDNLTNTYSDILADSY